MNNPKHRNADPIATRIREFSVDDLEGDEHIRIRVRGSDRLTDCEATVDIEGGWELTQRFRETAGAWVADGAPTLVHVKDQQRRPTARLRRRTIDRYLPAINAVVREALRIDDGLHEDPEWREMIARRWRLTEIRSRRGPIGMADLDAVEARLEAGETLPRIAADLGFAPQSLANARHRAGRRSLDEKQRD